MRRQLVWAIVGWFATTNSLAAAQSVTAFVRFNVVPMTTDTVLRDQTVLVADGRIAAVGPSRTVKVPRGAARVDGEAKQFLVPALADMHTHATNPAELALFASHGVLTILNMGWSPDPFVALERLRYNSGEKFGPTIFEARRMNRPYGRTSGIATVAQGRDTVRFVKKLGYDFIKVYSFLDDTVYDAIMQEAKAQGITVIGHQRFGIRAGSHAVRYGYGWSSGGSTDCVGQSVGGSGSTTHAADSRAARTRLLSDSARLHPPWPKAVNREGREGTRRTQRNTWLVEPV